MGSILFAWELGGGLGHVLPIAAVANALAAQGHRVVVALRELPPAHGQFHPRVRLLPSPYLSRGRSLPHPTRSFADVLAQVGWAEDRTLFPLATAWRSLLRLVEPDLVLFDNAPTAVLASRGLPLRRALIGIPFSMPPDRSPFPCLRSRDAEACAPERLHADEAAPLERVNRLLASWREPALERLGQPYSEVDQTFLTTLPELDPYARSRPRRTPYWGPPPPPTGGAAPQWPDAPGPKVFAYLKPFRALPELLGFLTRERMPTLLFIDGRDDALRARFQCPTLHFAPQRVDLPRAAAECDLSVLHAGHGATCSMLLAGKPCLLIPLHLEQGLTARAVRRLGAGLDAPARDAARIIESLSSLLSSPQHAAAARRFSERYSHIPPHRQQALLIDRVRQLLSPRTRPPQRSAPVTA